MNSKSRFTKIAVSAGLVVMSGAAVLGLTGYASANLAPSDVPAATEQVVIPSADEAAAQDATVAAAGDVIAAGDAIAAGDVAAAGDAIAAGDVAAAGAPAQGGHTPISPVNLAKALGLTETELKTQVQSGKSLADIAKAQNVDIQKVKDALVADLKAHLDAEVKAGEHTQAEADAKLAGFTARLDDIVNNVRPAGAHGKGGHGPMGGAPRFATDALAKVLGLSTTELKTQLQSGKSLADLAKAQNVDIQKVKDQLLADFTAKEQAEVASGEHTQAEVDAKIAEFKTRLDDMVNGVRPAGAPGMGGREGKAGVPRFVTDALAKVLGLSTTELKTQLQSGKSLADIAKAQNVDIQKVKDQLLADFTAKEQAEVASGEHTQAEVDAKIAEFKTRLDDMVNGVRPAGAPGKGGNGPMGGHGGRHGHGPMGGDSGRGPAGTQDTGFSA